MEKRRICLNLDEDSIKILEDLKWKSRMSKSKLIRKILYYFEENQSQLKKILMR